MEINRRLFFKISGSLAAASLVQKDKPVLAADPLKRASDGYGCLVDTTLCIGCRMCEQACNERHRLSKPRESFEEPAVLERMRRMDETSYTVINRYGRKETNPSALKNPQTFVKFQCMHCQDPACVSACIVGALTKESSGPVT
ncbi:MAG: 4Fe-4S ferredoxin, partial [Deltaproteobacteria bacterium]|nr:4Fe-4S ferredoxin [Deltaproteobacteria bacterium]